MWKDEVGSFLLPEQEIDQVRERTDNGGRDDERDGKDDPNNQQFPNPRPHVTSLRYEWLRFYQQQMPVKSSFDSTFSNSQFRLSCVFSEAF